MLITHQYSAALPLWRPAAVRRRRAALTYKSSPVNWPRRCRCRVVLQPLNPRLWRHSWRQRTAQHCETQLQHRTLSSTQSHTSHTTYHCNFVLSVTIISTFIVVVVVVWWIFLMFRIQNGSGVVRKARWLVHVGTHVQRQHHNASVSVTRCLLARTAG